VAIIAGVTNSFKEEMLKGEHNLSSNTLKIALYSTSASIGPGTTAYTTSGEVSGSNYSAGGNTLSGVSITVSGGTVYVDFTDSVWSSATISDVSGALIYNSSVSNKSIAVLDFGVSSGISVSASDFTVKFPSANADDAIIRIS
jgi:hypothetical protein